MARPARLVIVLLLRWLGAAVGIFTLVLVHPVAAQEQLPAPGASSAGDDLGVDVITAAGEDTGPPKRAPSFDVKEPELKVRWNPAWKRFTLGNYIGTGVLLAATLGSLAIPPAEERWLTRNTFDDNARSVLRLKTQRGRNLARDASDVTLLLATNLLLVDTLIVSWWGHDAGDVAWEVAMMSIEALAFNNAINGLVSALASRQRPYGFDLCQSEEGENLSDCVRSKRYRSFFSGHSSTTFTVAGLTCMHHAHLPLYGGGLPDILACGSAFGLAAGTALLRVVGDQHWTSDILVGAAWGSFSGLFIPWFFHYRTGDMPDVPKLDDVSIMLIPTPTGAQLTGAF